MLALLVFACLINGGDESCDVAVVAGGFVHERQCLAYRRLMLAGWEALHPDMEIRRAVCTDKPEFVIGMWRGA